MRKPLLGSASVVKRRQSVRWQQRSRCWPDARRPARFQARPWSKPRRRSPVSTRPKCDAWWARAQVWVINHSEYKLQTVTDSIIQTDGPSGGKRALAYQITKTPSNEGTATIGFAAHCDNMLGCEPNPWKAGADFKQFVRGGPSQMGTPGGATASGTRCRRFPPRRHRSRCSKTCRPADAANAQNQPGQSGQT